MSATRSTRFFRPWNIHETVGGTNTASAGGNENRHEMEGPVERQDEDVTAPSGVTSGEVSSGSSSDSDVSSAGTMVSAYSDGAIRSISMAPQESAFQIANYNYLASTLHQNNTNLPNSFHLGLDLASSSTSPTVFPAMLGMYCPSSMDQAVERVHLQDAAAKQMKKLRPKKFRCELCDVAFSNNGQLKGHVRIHTGERPFKCDAEGCGKSFTRNEELTRHKRIHTGVRPHGCIVCGKHFGRKDHLKKHMRTHENRDPYRVSAAALGMFALGSVLPQGSPFPPYLYPF
ncbi:uncharacterized protein LOC117603954 [Osmia lignaria lignaria]|uniref:uncharacterized protein LOC117603954 n=1 Tax=Osmia lignaria lignaria TaxID=1437193 RepID=UPI00402BDAD9